LSLLSGHILKRDYAGRVVELRRKYPILSIPMERWVVQENGRDW
jgi:hypothetical protein